MNTLTQPLNKILYGPPGTGKTYKTKKLAVEIIEGKEFSDSTEDRGSILTKYEELVKSKNIIFTTFHQSMSYEDFIEGIKPVINEDNETELSYEVKNGLFKAICIKAAKTVKSIDNSKEIKEEVEFFDIAWNEIIKEVENKIGNEETPFFKTLTDKILNVEGVTDKGNLLIKPAGGSDLTYLVSYNRSKKLFEAYPEGLNQVKNIDKEFRQVIGGSNSTAYWSVLNRIYSWIEDNHDKVITESVNEITQNSDFKNHVIIIDEINRGNVSAIFGELITLIEEDKRKGCKEEINLTLPYSKELFSVPNNLYIIGTMNTADRSVEALDTALRRRFSFEELLPKPDLLKDINCEGVDIAKLLSIINERIELLIDKDHQIGHSYFFSVKSLGDLKLVFQDKIIPLLEEYFYGDYGKIGLVLGESFIAEKHTQNKNILASFKAYSDVDFITDKKIFKLKDISNMTVADFKSIYETV